MAGSASWQPVGDQFYRLDRVYSLDDSPLARLDLSDYSLIAHAPAAGSIALARDSSKPVPLDAGHHAHSHSRDQVAVYSLAGALLQTISWDPSPPARIVHLSFTSTSTTESLVVLTATGQYRLYLLSAHPSLPPDYSQHAIPNLQDAGIQVREAKPFPDGFVALLDDGAFVEVRIPSSVGGPVMSDTADSWSSDAIKGTRRRHIDGDEEMASSTNGGRREHRAIPLAPTGLDPTSPLPDCWCVLPPDPTSTRTLEVLFAKGETVFRLDEIDCIDQVRVRGGRTARSLSLALRVRPDRAGMG